MLDVINVRRHKRAGLSEQREQRPRICDRNVTTGVCLPSTTTNKTAMEKNFNRTNERIPPPIPRRIRDLRQEFDPIDRPVLTVKKRRWHVKGQIVSG